MLAQSAALVLLMTAASTASAIVIESLDDPETAGAELASTIQGSGIGIDDGSIVFVGVAGQSGFFSDGVMSGLGIDRGIILTTGLAESAVGPNSTADVTTNHGTPGDDGLTILFEGAETLDANVLEFDFTTDTGNLFFEYVFASEEYGGTLVEDDAFALFVDGSNLATAPDGQSVSVSTVNCGTGSMSMGPNCDSFVSNADGTADLAYDGFTTTFVASVTGLDAGPHTIRFAIADVKDPTFDSAVFIATDSFTSGTPIDEPAMLGLMLFGVGVLLRKGHRSTRLVVLA